jgi:hypothetical protein
MNKATFDEGTLADVHQLPKLGRQSVGEHFGYELTNRVDEGDWPIITHCLYVSFLW